ncbi:Mannosyl-glycoprotein endo-beta-N-acetylglucosamidase [Weissella viridescens]|jgi:flagellum-specific peptidoglycan hydrolase FlgJ|uniref:Mannosyl-glycoprotein endo-beta-n-acetylglucosamidase n=1 Tax=Weissella viridescens TaxID=1629 RepID=A0A0R2GZ71_WEIVI|nr:glycoside hydrolase family 73 protein [Weissella viridescens]KRN46035.1 mannosyl-glycoprotein endo-beta-n-acetylglucosamidase [Weissella viridescens]MBX4172747.1 glycoside hydrolase family 73 protein [Weissella viridescens]GEA95008.1 N-acetylmuramidase [Weissella viridescens]SOB44289.1 Mannosyl-glycoprotein endo-beta-N-acetylglucosamidase [Weissella viridescens]
MAKKKENNVKVITALCIILTIASLVTIKLVQLNTNINQPSTHKPAKSQHEVFIEEVAPTAVQIQKQDHVPASISIAQAALESNWGTSKLAADYNNLYGVKGSAETKNIELPTKEFVHGEWKTVQASFRWYDSWNQSMWAHATLLVNGTTDNSNRYTSVLQSNDYHGAAKALVAGGYATDPQYAEKLIEIIETYHLDKYDKQ